jgi:HK97 family phage prohead protease
MSQAKSPSPSFHAPDSKPAAGRRYLAAKHGRPRLESRTGVGSETQPTMITGYAAVFYDPNDPGTEYQLYQDVYERIMPSAFNAAVQEDVVRGLTNHDSNWLLGRSDLGTLRLSIDKVGLRYEIDPPDTQAGRDTLALLARGDLDGSSFSFATYGGRRGKTVWVQETRDGRTVDVREIHDVELYDVGPVTFPAYESTTAGARGKDWPEHAREAYGDRERWQLHEAAERTAELAALSVPLDLDTMIAEGELVLLGV